MPSTTIIAQPAQLMPAYNPIKYIIDNTNKNEPGFRYIFSIYPAAGSHTTATLIAQYRVLPVFSTGYGEQDISMLMQSLVTYNETGIGTFESYDSSESWYQYDVDLGFEYIDNVGYTAALTIDGLNTNITSTTAHGFIVGDQIVITQADGGVANPALEGLHTVISVTNSTNFTVNVLWSTITNININGNVTYADLRKTQVLDDALITNKEVFNGAYNNYINTFSSTAFPSANYLANNVGDLLMTTNAAGSNNAASTFLDGFLYYNLRVYASRVYAITWYDMDGNQLDSQSFTPASNGIWAVYVGPQTASITQDYYVQVTNDNGFLSQDYYFTYDNRCAINDQQLIYLDRMGSWQSFAFQLRTYEKGQITREQYNQHIDGQVSGVQWVGVNLQKGFRTYNTNVTKTFDLNTNWMDQYDANRFQELLTSPQVYYFKIEDNFEDEYYCACVVESSSFEVFSQKNKKLIKQSVTIKLAQQDPING
jgi:hypothetical protein